MSKSSESEESLDLTESWRRKVGVWADGLAAPLWRADTALVKTDGKLLVRLFNPVTDADC